MWGYNNYGCKPISWDFYWWNQWTRANLKWLYHGFRKRTKAELNHNLRYDINSNHASRDEKTYKRALMTGSRNLAEAATYNIPELKWTKELQPSGDSNALSLLQTAKEMGLPIPISYLSTYAGIPLPTLMDSLTEDLEARKKLKEYTDELNKINPPPKEDDEGMFASVKEKEDKFNSKNKHRILGNNNFNFNYNKELVSKLNHSHVIPAKEIVKIKDKDSLLNYLQQNITDDVKITKSQAKKLIQQANAVKPGLVKF